MRLAKKHKLAQLLKAKDGTRRGIIPSVRGGKLYVTNGSSAVRLTPEESDTAMNGKVPIEAIEAAQRDQVEFRCEVDRVDLSDGRSFPIPEKQRATCHAQAIEGLLTDATRERSVTIKLSAVILLTTIEALGMRGEFLDLIVPLTEEGEQDRFRPVRIQRMNQPDGDVAIMMGFVGK